MAGIRTLGTVALIGLVVLAGCVGSGGDAGGAPEPSGGDGAEPAADAATPAPDQSSLEAEQERAQMSGGAANGDGGDGGGDGGGDAVDDAVAEQAQPALIKTGTVRLEVEDADRTRRALVQRARGLGGYVGDSGETRHREDNRTWETGYVVLRIPSGEFSTMLEAAREEGTVLEANTQTEDVSDQLVDLEARLDNLRAQRDRLRQFYEDANTTDEMLRIERRLSEVQGEIERLEARKRALEDRVAYSTLRIEYREPSPTPTPTPTPTPAPSYHETPLLAAFAASVQQLIVLGRSALVTLAYALPYLLVAGIPLGVAIGGVYWRARGERGRDSSDE